ncbi:MAG: type II secretion system protein [Akkermansiaceae bacterium]|nr:prepilin-type N-terminal cleavage/methylation domain-containing protein [Luteolibacter sp.]
MKINTNRKRGFTLVELLVVIVIIATLGAIATPVILRAKKQGNKAEAISNAKQIGLALFEFDSDYGSYPDGDTATEVEDAFPDAEIKAPSSASDSNSYFLQLFQAGIVSDESIFKVKAEGIKTPDGDISSASEALASGENGFGYIMNGTEAYSSAGNASRIILVTPLVPGGDTFDINPFNGDAVVFKINNSATTIKIRAASGAEDGPAIVAGKDFLEAKFWGTTTPTIVKPKTD